MKLMADRMFPALKKVRTLSLDVAGYKQGFLNSFYRNNLSRLQESYREINKEFLEIYHTYQVPDELFKEINEALKDDQQNMAKVMMDYMQSNQSVLPHLREGLALLDNIDKTLTRYEAVANQTVTNTLAVAAITATLIGAIITWLPKPEKKEIPQVQETISAPKPKLGN